VVFYGFFVSDFFVWIALPLFIFCARILDVSLGTIRVIFISRGFKYYAALIGFFEILIWLFAISQLMANMNNPVLFLFYAGGFSAGTFIGIILEEKLSLGTVLIEIITKNNSTGMIDRLLTKNFKFTCIDAQGSHGEVKMIFVVTKRQNITKVIDIVKSFNPKAFYSIEDIRYANEEKPHKKSYFDYLRHFPAFKKGK